MVCDTLNMVDVPLHSVDEFIEDFFLEVEIVEITHRCHVTNEGFIPDDLNIHPSWSTQHRTTLCRYTTDCPEPGSSMDGSYSAVFWIICVLTFHSVAHD